MVKGFDGTDRPGMPSARELATGCVAEMVAMTLFVYFGCGSAASNAHKRANGEWDPASVTLISLQFGLGITVLAYATAHTSGGHINCAVTWALTLVGKCHPIRAIGYLAAQLLGSVLGAALLKGTTSGGEELDRSGALGANGLQHESVTVGNALLVEVMGTALLVFTVLETAVNGQAVTTEGESAILGNKQNLAPLPIGLSVFLAHTVCIPVTGCSINPTRSFGPSAVSGSWDDHWLWWVGPLLGATVASLLWLVMKMLDWGGAVAHQEKQDRKRKLSEERSVRA